MDLRSILGYSKGSPWENAPYNLITTNQGKITMSKTKKRLKAFDAKTGEFLSFMEPGKEYQFPTNQVLEIPVNKSGGWLQKYQTGDTFESLTGIKPLKNVKQQSEVQPTGITTPELKSYKNTTSFNQGKKISLQQQKINQKKKEAYALANGYTMNNGEVEIPLPLTPGQQRFNKGLEHIATGLEAALYITGAGEVLSPLVKKAATYLTEQTALKNAYKLNPKAFIPNPEAYYRGIGKAGYKDALESNTLRVNQNPQWDDAFGRKFDPSTQSPYFFKGNNFEGVKAYNSDVIAELTDHEMKSRTFSNVANFGKVEGDVGYIPPVYQPAKQVGSLGKFKVIEKVNQVPVGENTRFLKKDWWQGYKEVPKNTSGDVWWNGKGYQSTPLNNPTIQPKKKLQEIIEEARTLYHNNGVESLSERQKALIEFHGEKEGSNYITAAKKEQNLKDLEYAKQYYQKFGYDIPNNLKEIANSSVTTDNIIKDLVNQHNTFVRGVSTNWKELEARNPEILRHLEGKGIDWKNNPKAAAEYMATHIPIQTGYGRASLNSNIFNKGMDGLYTSNSVKTAEGYTYGDGFVVKAKRPTDFSSPNRQDWLNKNKLDYYEHDIPRALTKEDLEAQKGWLSSNMRETFNEKTLGNKENADKVNKWLDEVSAKDIELRKKYGIVPQGQGDYAMIGVKGDHPEFDMLRKQKLEDVKKYHEEYNTLYNNSKNEVWKTLKPTTGTLNKNLLKTEHTSFGKIGNMFGQYGNTSFDVLNMLEPISANVVKHDVQLSNIVKEIGKKYNPNILKKIEELSDLGVKMNKSPKQIKRVTELEAEITSVKQASQQEVLDAHKAYLTRHYPGWENMENKYAHYIHLGTPGEKVLEPIESIRITPEMWKNKSRAHTNTYSKGLSAGVTTGVVAGAAALQQKKEGGWLQKYQQGGYTPKDPRKLVRNLLSRTDATKVGNIPTVNIPIDKQVIKEMGIAEDNINKKELVRRKKAISNSNSKNTFESSALGDKMRFFPNDPNSLIDDYINPLKMVGDMADNIGHTVSDSEASTGRKLLALATPMGVGALGSIGAKNTTQFVNNLTNPLAGINLSKIDDMVYRNLLTPKKVEKINTKNIYRELGQFIPNDGGQNKGIYNLKRFPEHIVKFEDVAKIAETLHTPNYSQINLVDAMKSLPDNTGKVLNQIKLKKNREFLVPSDDEYQALIMKKLSGVPSEELSAIDYRKMPDEAIKKYYESIKKVRNNNLAYDYYGNNYHYDKGSKSFNIFDINPNAKGDSFWSNDIQGGSNLDNFSVEESAKNIKQAIHTRLTNDYEANANKVTKKYLDKKWGKNTILKEKQDFFNKVKESKEKYSSRIENILKDLDPHKKGGWLNKYK